MSPEAALVLCRFARFAAAALLWGAAAYLAVLVPRPLAAPLWQRLRPAIVAAVVVVAVAALAAVPVEAARIGDGWVDAFDYETLSGVLFSTTVGQALLVQAAAALALLLALMLRARAQIVAVAAGAGITLAASALTGHAVMQDGTLGLAHRLIDAIHILCAGAWVGALVPLALLLGYFADAERRVYAALSLRRFSNAGQVVVTLIILSGIANTWLLLRQAPLDWSSPYQALLAIKIALVAVMVAVASANRYAFSPAISAEPEDALRALRQGTIVELALGTVVLALVAAFGTLDPM